ncbi:MAG: hypothetical protein WBW38_04035, partial [Candidatus Sulfotelmatobacter sp.]
TIPRRTTTPTKIRMILRAPPPWGVEAGGAEGTDVELPAAGTGGRVEARMGAPHLLQKRVPGTMDVPHELQNAISHLISIDELSSRREYTAD